MNTKDTNAMFGILNFVTREMLELDITSWS